ncbi:hypothetical protein RND71_013407 [Anisodus tanguticus]|uniref:Uncharacterized protein n=1 Tax=Anisodus tanguticus TaxID=243964 RepID=A0AAE1SGK2_9SOLA|nr:hypothetical protein RND71_013407 [Anisodus tanguticus]
MMISRIVYGNLKEASHPDTLRAAFAEFISMLIFVFTSEGCSIAFMSSNISGGHVNPAVTFGCFLGGHITLCRSVLYWIAQLLGSVVALSLLKFATSGSDTTSYALKAGATPWNAIIFEIVMTFGLVYTVYATTIDPKRGNMESIAPIVIGFLVGANVLSGGDELIHRRDEEEANSSSLDKLLKEIDEFEFEEEVANCGLGEEECLECEAPEDDEDNSDRVSMPEKFKSITVEKSWKGSD